MYWNRRKIKIYTDVVWQIKGWFTELFSRAYLFPANEKWRRLGVIAMKSLNLQYTRRMSFFMNLQHSVMPNWNSDEQ